MSCFIFGSQGTIRRFEGLFVFADCDEGTTLHYRQIDVRDVPRLNEVVRSISDSQGKLDGLIAAAGIQQEVSALEYTAKDANTMFEVGVGWLDEDNLWANLRMRRSISLACS